MQKKYCHERKPSATSSQLHDATPTNHNTPHTLQFIIIPPTRRTNRRRPSARRLRAITRAVQVAALLAACYGLAYAITAAALS